MKQGDVVEDEQGYWYTVLGINEKGRVSLRSVATKTVYMDVSRHELKVVRGVKERG